ERGHELREETDNFRGMHEWPRQETARFREDVDRLPNARAELTNAAPVRANWQRMCFNELAVRDNASLARRSHRPADRCLVGWMIDARNPVPRAVRPVVSERCPTSSAIGANDQAVLWFPAVPHRHRE